MADTKISALASGSPAQATDAIPIARAGANFQLAASDLTTLAINNQFFAVSGPAASTKTFTFPNASSTVLTSNAAVTVAQGGTGITSGTDGGILGFTAAGTIASSAVLTASRIVLGGGAGATPTVLGSLGTTTTLLHGNAAGAPTFGAVTLTTDVTGVLPPANGGTALSSTSGQGWFASAGLLSPMTTESAVINPVGSGSAMRAFQFYLPVAITVRKVSINCTTLQNPSTVTVGIYDAAGTTKLIDSGTFDCSTTGAKTNTITGVALVPGVYWFVQSASVAGGALKVTGILATAGFMAMLNNNAAHVGDCANSASAGVLNAALGTVTTAALNAVFAVFEP